MQWMRWKKWAHNPSRWCRGKLRHWPACGGGTMGKVIACLALVALGLAAMEAATVGVLLGRAAAIVGSVGP